MIPTLTPETGLAEERREEAPREAEANSSNTAEAVVDGLDSRSMLPKRVCSR